MGTIRVEEWEDVGTNEDKNVPVYRKQTAITVDATTSTSDETITLTGGPAFVSIHSAVGDHRFSLGSTTGSKYVFIAAGERRDIAVTGTTVAYRLDA